MLKTDNINTITTSISTDIGYNSTLFPEKYNSLKKIPPSDFLNTIIFKYNSILGIKNNYNYIIERLFMDDTISNHKLEIVVNNIIYTILELKDNNQGDNVDNRSRNTINEQLSIINIIINDYNNNWSSKPIKHGEYTDSIGKIQFNYFTEQECNTIIPEIMKLRQIFKYINSKSDCKMGEGLLRNKINEVRYASL